jgi:HTH-type transcriptional regulator / antitoxin HigA
MADRYIELLTEFQPRPIHSEKALARAYRLIEKLMRKDNLSADEADMLEMLSVLVEQFESRENPTPVLSSSELLEHLIEAHGLSQSDVAREAQIPRSTISEIVAGQRGISKTNIAKLAKYFRVSPSSFIETERQ